METYRISRLERRQAAAEAVSMAVMTRWAIGHHRDMIGRYEALVAMADGPAARQLLAKHREALATLTGGAA